MQLSNSRSHSRSSFLRCLALLLALSLTAAADTDKAGKHLFIL